MPPSSQPSCRQTVPSAWWWAGVTEKQVTNSMVKSPQTHLPFFSLPHLFLCFFPALGSSNSALKVLAAHLKSAPHDISQFSRLGRWYNYGVASANKIGALKWNEDAVSVKYYSYIFDIYVTKLHTHFCMTSPYLTHTTYSRSMLRSNVENAAYSNVHSKWERHFVVDNFPCKK